VAREEQPDIAGGGGGGGGGEFILLPSCLTRKNGDGLLDPSLGNREP